MQSRSLDDIASEFTEENHQPMLRLVQTMKTQSWAGQLVFDTSMLRIWAARRFASEVEITITYGDGRKGGRPLDGDLDAFDLAMKVNGAWSTAEHISTQAVLERMHQWLEAR
jgi:hypothetical protein